jgi:type VI secretion system secreted protein Hcp
MACDYYLWMSGITGESEALGMTDNLEVLTWGFGANTPSDLSGKGLSGGKPYFDDFNCTFPLDSSSYQIISSLCKGTHIESIVFTGRKSGGDESPYKYIQVTMSNCLIAAFDVAGESVGVPSFQLKLAFNKIEYAYFTQDSASGAVKNAGNGSWSVKQVVAA